jgi:hypothetical protein
LIPDTGLPYWSVTLTDEHVRQKLSRLANLSISPGQYQRLGRAEVQSR